MQHANELEHKLAAAQEEYDSVANHVEELRVDNNTLTQYNDELVATVRMFDCLQTQKPTIIC
jgi:putative hemolysin